MKNTDHIKNFLTGDSYFLGKGKSLWKNVVVPLLATGALSFASVANASQANVIDLDKVMSDNKAINLDVIDLDAIVANNLLNKKVINLDDFFGNDGDEEVIDLDNLFDGDPMAPR